MTSESVMHSEHHHELFLVNEGNIFRCSGCHEDGAGNHYKCTHSDPSCTKFHLHIACAEGPVKLKRTLPLYGDRYVFDFNAKPVNNDRYCVACGKRIRRYNYRCSRKNLDLHPSCTRDFPLEHTVNGVPVWLEESINGKTCLICKKSKYGDRKLDTWAYVSKTRKKRYFAGCVLDSQIKKYKKALRDGSGSSSQVTRSTSLDSQKGSTSGSPVNPKETPGLLYRILEPAATIANSITQGITIITGIPLSSP